MNGIKVFFYKKKLLTKYILKYIIYLKMCATRSGWVFDVMTIII